MGQSPRRVVDPKPNDHRNRAGYLNNFGEAFVRTTESGVDGIYIIGAIVAKSTICQAINPTKQFLWTNSETLYKDDSKGWVPW